MLNVKFLLKIVLSVLFVVFISSYIFYIYSSYSIKISRIDSINNFVPGVIYIVFADSSKVDKGYKIIRKVGIDIQENDYYSLIQNGLYIKIPVPVGKEKSFVRKLIFYREFRSVGLDVIGGVEY